MSKVPCGGFELDESLALNNGKLGLAPGAGGSQADWNVTDSADPAFIKNKPFGDVPGVEVFSKFSADTTETNDDGNEVFTFTSSSIIDANITLVNIKIGNKTYENIAAIMSYTSGTTWEYTFNTTGLPFTVKAESGYGTNSTVKVTSLDGSYINSITITDMKRNSQVKLSAKYINTTNQHNGLGSIFPICSGAPHDKVHLVYDSSKDVYKPTYDVYLKSSSNGSSKIFKLTVDDSGSLTATEV